MYNTFTTNFVPTYLDSKQILHDVFSIVQYHSTYKTFAPTVRVMDDVNKIWIKMLTFRISVSPNLFSISVDFSVSSMARQINKWKFLHGRSVQNTCQTKNKNKIRSIIVIEASLTKYRLSKIANMLKVLLYVLSMNSRE